ncbi:MAG: glycosyltransferase family 4 protein [Microscillaceae bacterium]|nr:glycosyltransferase family 4 protein [Microscillaceae bacterium]
MFLENQHKALYAAFDVYPTAKGAATHIYHFAGTLFDYKKGGWLSVLGSPKLPDYQWEKGVEITRFSEEIPNFLERTRAYGNYLFDLLADQKNLEICHFRDPWSGIPILAQKKEKKFLTVFEVNGLPSIELPFRYPKIMATTLHKIKQLEQYCLQASDHILVPSQVIRNYLLLSGVPSAKIKVIGNGAEIPQNLPYRDDLPEQYLIYFGALQSWQGVDTLLRAMIHLADFSRLKLVICSSNRPRYSRPFQKLAEKLEIQHKIIWKHQLRKKELYTWIKQATLSVAPLKECSRNLQQGCSPLKVLESMALATPVIASDIPAIREIMPDNSLGSFVRADRPIELARSIRLLLDNPDYTQKLGEAAQEHIRQNHLWQQKKQELAQFYKEIEQGL